MIEIAIASINTFGTSPKADFVPTSEQLITLTYGQLQDLVTQAVEKAIQPLQDRISALEEERDQDRQDIAALEAAQAVHADNQLIQLRLINDLREATKKEPQPLQKDRGDILRALLAANGGKMLAKEARQKMHLKPWAFSRLLATMKDDIEIKAYHLRKNQKLLVLK
jgi:hypothetical protein